MALLAGVQYLAAKRDEANHPAPGELIDVGGYKLHFQSQGESQPGKPTVIVETGIWDCSQSWKLVQSEVAKTMRICSYDRAGYGWSEKGKKPRTFDQMVRELKILLEKKGIHPPFIFVGHSLGGAIMRYYQSRYPEEVAGMIFVDAVHQEAPVFSRVFWAVSKALSFLSHFGVMRLLYKMCPPLSKNPEWTSTMQKTYTVCHQRSLATCLDEWDGYEESFGSLRAQAKSLKDIPVTVISRGLEVPVELNQRHLADSPHARFVIAEGSSHLVQVDRPDVIVDEIRQMYDQH